MGMYLNPCTLFSLIFPFDSRAFEVSNRFIVMVPQNSTVANGKTVSIPDLASHARVAAIGPEQTTLCVDPFPVRPPRLNRASAKALTPFARRMRKRERAGACVGSEGWRRECNGSADSARKESRSLRCGTLLPERCRSGVVRHEKPRTRTRSCVISQDTCMG